jgi:uncharacterized SAM-binding protein YcdF (DUF218 family)
MLMEHATYDAILITGEGFNSDGSLADITKARLEKATEMYKGGRTSAIIICGLYGYKAIEKPAMSEAAAYAEYLYQLGVPKQAIRLEVESQESLGNILFAKMKILIKEGWRKILVMPSYNQSNDRIEYLLQKILGPEYEWQVQRIGENKDPTNLAREAKALMYTKEINDAFDDGDHDAIYKGLMQTHPAYGGTKWTTEELRAELSA